MKCPILVVECDSLTSITENSIKRDMPDWDYKVVSYKDGFIPTALNNIDDITLVVRGGVILNIKEKDLPDRETLEKYHICISKDAVFGDNDIYKNIYNSVGLSSAKNIVDLSIFIINPKKWETIPDSDSKSLQDTKRLRMPRYMNHKTDDLLKDVLTGKTAMDYGMLAEQASVYNYIPIYKKGTVNGNEMMAYALEKVLPFLDDLEKEDKTRISKVALETFDKFYKLRTGLAENLN